MYHQFGGSSTDLGHAMASSPTHFDQADEDYDQYFRDDLRRSLIDDWKTVLSSGFLAALAPASSPVKPQRQQRGHGSNETRIVGKVLEGVDSIGEAAIRWIESLEDTLAGALTVPTLLPPVAEDPSEPSSPSTASQPSTSSPSSSSSSDDLPATAAIHRPESPPPPFLSGFHDPVRTLSPPLKQHNPTPRESVRVSIVADSTLHPVPHKTAIPSTHPLPVHQPRPAQLAPKAAAAPPAPNVQPAADPPPNVIVPARDPLAALQQQLLESEAKSAQLLASCKLLARKCKRLKLENQDLKAADPMLSVLHGQLTALLADKSRLTQENEALRRENASLHELLAYASHGANESEPCYTPSGSIPDPLDFHHHLLAEGYYDPPPPLRTRSAPASPTPRPADLLPDLPRPSPSRATPPAADRAYSPVASPPASPSGAPSSPTTTAADTPPEPTAPAHPPPHQPPTIAIPQSPSGQADPSPPHADAAAAAAARAEEGQAATGSSATAAAALAAAAAVEVGVEAPASPVVPECGTCNSPVVGG